MKNGIEIPREVMIASPGSRHDFGQETEAGFIFRGRKVLDMNRIQVELASVLNGNVEHGFFDSSTHHSTAKNKINNLSVMIFDLETDDSHQSRVSKSIRNSKGP